MISRSKKFSAAARTWTSASPGPATGSGISPKTKSSDVPARVHRRAFIALDYGPGFQIPSAFRRNDRVAGGLVQGGGCDIRPSNSRFWPIISLYLGRFLICVFTFPARGPMRLDRSSHFLVLSLLAAAAAALPSVATAQSRPAANPAAQATLLGQFGDWGAYMASPG